MPDRVKGDPATRTYENETAWRAIQSFLPEDNRIDERCAPVEEPMLRLQAEAFVRFMDGIAGRA